MKPNSHKGQQMKALLSVEKQERVSVEQGLTHTHAHEHQEKAKRRRLQLYSLF